MNYNRFIYLIIDESRLVITEKEIEHENYFLLINTDGEDENILQSGCEMFCLGFITSSYNEIKVKNNINEFL